MNAICSRIAGGIYGVAIGDALGATLEYCPQVCRSVLHTEMTGGGWLDLRKGEWTDDTELTIAVANGIVDDQCNPVPAVGKHFMAWFASDPPSIGNTTRKSLGCFARTGDWTKASPKEDCTATNGALMRTLPVAFAYRDENLYRYSLDIAGMTHGALFAGLTCYLYCLIAGNLLAVSAKTSFREVYGDACERFARGVKRWGDYAASCRLQEFLENLEFASLSSKEMAHRSATGHIADTLSSALWALMDAVSLEGALIKAVNLGGDADTVGAVTGGLAGVRWGYEAIPDRWLQHFTAKQRARLDHVVKCLCQIEDAD